MISKTEADQIPTVIETLMRPIPDTIREALREPTRTNDEAARTANPEYGRKTGATNSSKTATSTPT